MQLSSHLQIGTVEKIVHFMKRNQALQYSSKIHLDMIPCITPLIFKNILIWNVIVLVKQRSSVVLVLIISLICIDSASTLSLCGFPVPPALLPFLQPQDTKNDAPLEEVTGCHCLALLIFTSPSLHHFKTLPQVTITNTLKVTNGLQMHLTLQ